MSSISRTNNRCYQHTCDANWARQTSDRRNTSEGVLMHTRCAVFRRGSGRSIWDQRLGTIVEPCRVQRRQRSLGCDTTPRPGRLRHVDCNFFLEQSLNSRKVVQHAKVLGSDNLADVCIKGLNAELMTLHASAADGRCSAGRPT